MQISFAVTAKLISAFVFDIRIVQSLYFLKTKFHDSNHLLWLYSPVCVRPGQKPRRPAFSERGSFQECGIIKLQQTCNENLMSSLFVLHYGNGIQQRLQYTYRLASTMSLCALSFFISTFSSVIRRQGP